MRAGFKTSSAGGRQSGAGAGPVGSDAGLNETDFFLTLDALAEGLVSFDELFAFSNQRGTNSAAAALILNYTLPEKNQENEIII